jgi:RNA-binding protein
MKKKNPPAPLPGKHQRFLRSLGHHLTQSVIVGREGISDNLVQSCNEGLGAHELIKVRLGQNCPVEKKEAAQELAAKTGSHLVQLIGKTVLLYKPNPDLPRDQGIRLPR